MNTVLGSTRFGDPFDVRACAVGPPLPAVHESPARCSANTRAGGTTTTLQFRCGSGLATAVDDGNPRSAGVAGKRCRYGERGT